MISTQFFRVRRPGFTLIELLVVIGVVGILIAMIIPAVQSVRLAAQRTSCANNLRQLGIALLNHESQHRVFPAGLSWNQNQGRYRHSSWLFHLLPFVEQSSRQQAGIQEWSAGVPFTQHAGFQSVVATYQCPSDPRSGMPHFTHMDLLAGTTSYVGVAGTDYTTQDGVLFQDSSIRSADIQDGLSQTLLVGERPPSTDYWYGWWYAGTGQLLNDVPTGSPDMILGARERNVSTTFDAATCPPGPFEFGAGDLNQQCSLFHFWSPHPGGANFLMCDGALHFFTYDIDPSLIPAMATRSSQ